MPRHVTGSFGNPFDQKRQHADLHVALDAPGEPMVHGRHLDLGALERAEAALYDHQPFVSAGGIFKADGVVVGLDHPFARQFL